MKEILSGAAIGAIVVALAALGVGEPNAALLFALSGIVLALLAIVAALKPLQLR